MRHLNSVSVAALATALLWAGPGAAQTANNIAATQLLMPFSTLLNSSAGQSALQGNLAGALAINNASSAATRSLAIHDNTIDTDRGTVLADGFGSKIQSLYFSAIYANNPLIGPANSNVVQAFRQANGITQADSGFAKNFFGSGTGSGSPSFTPVTGIAFPAGGQANVYDKAYAPIPASPGANLSGDSRPYQVRPGQIATFAGPTFVSPAPGGNPAGINGAVTTNAQILSGLGSNAAFPSGHTTYGFTQSIMFAMMAPELYSQMLLRASDYGYSRVVLGAHYPLDVIGGRVVATYDMAQLLNNNPAYMNQQISVFAVGNVTTTSNYANLFAAATADFRALISSTCGMSVAACAAQSSPYGYAQYQRDLATYSYRMTYGLTPTGPANLAPVVVVGAEVLLATRFPYLSADQRREVLATTEAPSGAVLDNGTGWARLNLFAASGGYGAIRANTTVAMDASLGGFNAVDIWYDDIGGGGVLTKAGTGWLTLAGKNSFGGLNVAGGLVSLTNTNVFSGATNVGGGPIAAALEVDGSLTSLGGVNVDGGGYLAGTGSVGPAVAIRAGGTLAPGNGIGTLTVNGNLSLASGSTYQVETNASGAGDRVHVTKTASVGGNLQVLTGAQPYKGSTQYTILTADGGRFGSFDSVSTGRLFVSPTVNYGANAVTLTLTRLPFQSVALSANQMQVAAGADSLGYGNPLWNAIDGQATAQSARTAFDSLSGEIYSSAKLVSVERSVDVRDAINSRLRQDALTDPALAGLAPVNPVVVADPAARTIVRKGYDAPAPVPAVVAPPTFALWGQAYDAFGHIDSNNNAAGVKQNTGGFIIGADAAVADGWRAGVAGGYSRSKIDVDGRLSSGDLDNYTAAVYGSGRFGGFALRLGAAYTWGDFDASRIVSFPGFSDAARGSLRLGTTQAFAEAGYDMRYGAIAIEPFAGLAFVNVNGDSFAEAGGPAALAGSSKSQSVTFTTLGARIGGNWLIGNMALTARAGLGWRHAFGDVTPDSLLAFAGGSPFVVSGAPIARDAAVIEAGLGLNVTQATILEVSYTGQLARQEQDQKIKASLKINF